jgi:hypothetical protein
MKINRDFIKGFLACALLGMFLMVTGLDVHIKNMARYAWENYESPIKLVPGNEAMKTYSLPADPSLDAPYFTAGPSKGYTLMVTSDSPLNNEQLKQRAYLYDNGKTWSLFVLTAKPVVTLSESWSVWVVNTTTTQINWVDENHLSFIEDGRLCTVEIGDNIKHCQ